MALTIDDLPRTFAALDAFVAAGGNAVDTANVYGPSPHRAVGEYLRANGRDTLILTDKVAHPAHDGTRRVTREGIREDLAINRERLGIDRIDVLVLHRDDPDVPVGEIVDWLEELVAEGAIDAYGGSNWSTHRMREARDYASAKGVPGFSLTSPQIVFANPNEPMWAGCVTLEPNEIAAYAEMAMPVFSWSSGANGYFAGREGGDTTRVYDNPENRIRRERARKLAEKYGTNPTAIAVAWVLAQPGQVHAIIGPRDADEVRANLSVLEIALSPDDLRFLTDGE